MNNCSNKEICKLSEIDEIKNNSNIISCNSINENNISENISDTNCYNNMCKIQHTNNELQFNINYKKLYQKPTNYSNKDVCFGRVHLEDDNKSYLKYMGVGIINNNNNRNIDKYCCKFIDYSIPNTKNQQKNFNLQCGKLTNNSSTFNNLNPQNISLHNIITDYNLINMDKNNNSQYTQNYSHSNELTNFMNNSRCINNYINNNDDLN